MDVNIVYMPAELLLETFKSLDEKNLGRCSLVCRQWEQIAKSNAIWKKMFPGIDLVIGERGVNIKEYIKMNNLQKISCITQLPRAFQSFLEKLSGKNVSFECLFPFNPKAKFITSYLQQRDAPIELKEQYILINPFEPTGYSGDGGRSSSKWEMHHTGKIPFESCLHPIHQLLTANEWRG
jgi:hypothetical protein